MSPQAYFEWSIIIGFLRDGRGSSGRRKSDQGASAVEFALIAPVMVLIIFILADIGRLGYVQISLNSAAQESVRASSFGMTTSEITAIANSAAGDAGRVASLEESATIVMTRVRSCSDSTSLGRTTEVRVSTIFKWVTPIDLFLSVTPSGASKFSSSINVTASGVMVCTG